MSAAPRRPIRLALVSREYPPFFGGGIGTYARWIVPALAHAGVTVHVITEAHDATHPRVETHGTVTVHRVPLAMGKGGWTTAAARFSLQAARTLTTLHAADRIDLAEFAECEGAAAALTLLQRASSRATPLPTQLPTLIHLHTPSEMLFQLRSLSTRAIDPPLGAYFTAERVAMRLADRLCAPSHFIADWALAHYALPVRPAVIPYALGPVESAPPPSQGKHLLYAGRIEPRKGVESLILAFRRVLEVHKDATLRLAGADTAGAPDGGSLTAYLTSLLSDRELASIRFLGKLDPDSLRLEYARASVCVVPSLWENFPNTCIEAMVHARAVVVSANGGMSEMIGQTTAGLIHTAGDAPDLARALISILHESDDARARRGQIGRDRILKLCDPATVAAARIDLFQDTIQRAKSSVARTSRPRLTNPTPTPSSSSSSIASSLPMLTEWRRAEHLLQGRTDTLNLPTLGGSITPWITPHTPTPTTPTAPTPTAPTPTAALAHAITTALTTPPTTPPISLHEHKPTLGEVPA